MKLPFKIVRVKKEDPKDPLIEATKEVITSNELQSFVSKRGTGRVIDAPIPRKDPLPYDELKEVRKYVIESISPEEEKMLLKKREEENGLY